MKNKLKVLAAPIAHNEEVKIARVFDRFKNLQVADEVVLMDDGSTDQTKKVVEQRGFRVITQECRKGVGAAIRFLIRKAIEEGFDIVVILAGNDKDRPHEIPKLVQPIVEDGYDFVQGSRYLPGGDFGNMPLYRQICTRFIHPFLFSAISGQKITDSTNGFRAIRLSIFKDKKIDLDQNWLDQYELEPYIFYKSIKLGYKVGEVPVTKIYPPKELGYTKMKPITGWWSILRPLFLLGLGIKK